MSSWTELGITVDTKILWYKSIPRSCMIVRINIIVPKAHQQASGLSQCQVPPASDLGKSSGDSK